MQAIDAARRPSCCSHALRRPVAADISERGLDLHAPHLIDVEIVGAVRRLVASGDARVERGEEAIADPLDLPLARHPTTSCRPYLGAA